MVNQRATPKVDWIMNVEKVPLFSFFFANDFDFVQNLPPFLTDIPITYASLDSNSIVAYFNWPTLW